MASSRCPSAAGPAHDPGPPHAGRSAPARQNAADCPGHRRPLRRSGRGPRGECHLALGRITALMGRNGSGKFSLLWTLQGSRPRHGGTVEAVGVLQGAAVRSHDPKRLPVADARTLVGLLRQASTDLLLRIVRRRTRSGRPQPLGPPPPAPRTQLTPRPVRPLPPLQQPNLGPAVQWPAIPACWAWARPVLAAEGGCFGTPSAHTTRQPPRSRSSGLSRFGDHLLSSRS